MLFDYSLLFVSCLHDYWEETGDITILTDLWPTAYTQFQQAALQLDDAGVIVDCSTWWCFLDWKNRLNKQASAQAIFYMPSNRESP